MSGHTRASEVSRSGHFIGCWRDWSAGNARTDYGSRAAGIDLQFSSELHDPFADAGLHVLRTSPADGPEIWCRCDGGPHGFLSIAAHGHADALSIEVRHDGVDLFVDPGTYCYHG